MLSLLTDLGWLIGGLVLLIFGADWLIHGAGVIARRLGVSPLVIGLTVVAFGTSAPELAAGVGAVLDGRADIPIGNAVGSNIANVGLILGVVALVTPFPCESAIVRKDVFLMIAATALGAYLLWDGVIVRLEAGVLVTLLFGYVAWTYLASADEEDEFAIEVSREAAAEFGEEGKRRLFIAAGLTLAGVVGLAGGAWMLVQGAVGLASAMGVPEYIVALVMVAIGTSIPELATTFRAVAKSEPDLAVGNVLGSNVFNLLCVVGVSGLFGRLSAPTSELRRDLIVMSGFALLCAPFLAWGRKLTRVEGVVFFVAYCAYVAFVFLSGTSGN